MGEMTEEEALSVLIKAARRDSPLPVEERESAGTLMKELGWLALALVHVGTYCHELSSGDGEAFTFTMYHKRFHSNRAALMKRAGPSTIDGYELGVYTTLDLSYQRLPQSAKEFFRLISNFHYSDIPMGMLATAAEEHFADPETLLARPEEHSKLVSRLTTLLGTSRSESEFQSESVIPTLRSFSLVSTTFIDGSLFLRIHPLVQAWARDMESPDAADYGIMATQVLTACTGDRNTNMYRHLLPHVTEKLKGDQRLSLHVNDQVAFGWVLLEMGRNQTAEVLFQEVLKSLQESSAEVTEDSIWVTGYLASTYSAQGRYNEAEKLDLEVLEKREKILGPDHLDTILAAADLAVTYSDQGRYGEAEKLLLEVLERREKILGADHLDTISAAANLASVYRDQGRHVEAEKLKLEVLEKRKKILGTEHLDTITAAANLASTYHAQGRYAEAEKLFSDVLEKRTKILGAEHPHTIAAVSNLASTYNGQQRFDEAEKLYVEVFEKWRAALGAEHPDTITAAGNLAATYSKQGRHGEAEKLELEVLEKRRKILGTEHPDTHSYRQPSFHLY